MLLTPLSDRPQGGSAERRRGLRPSVLREGAGPTPLTPASDRPHDRSAERRPGLLPARCCVPLQNTTAQGALVRRLDSSHPECVVRRQVPAWQARHASAPGPRSTPAATFPPYCSASLSPGRSALATPARAPAGPPA